MTVYNMEITRKCYNDLLKSYPECETEIGGIIGGKDGIITHVFFDKQNRENDCYKYIPNVKLLNKVIENWFQSGIDFYGMFHSHPNNENTFSEDDIKYIKSIINSMPDSYLNVFPLLFENKVLFFTFDVNTTKMNPIKLNILIEEEVK